MTFGRNCVGLDTRGMALGDIGVGLSHRVSITTSLSAVWAFQCISSDRVSC